MSTVSRRLLPFLLILYVFCYLDRSNVSIAALQMNDELRFSAAVFGIAGIWLIGQGIDHVILKPGGGGGSFLSGGVVAIAVAGWFTIPILKALTIRVPPNPAA